MKPLALALLMVAPLQDPAPKPAPPVQNPPAPGSSSDQDKAPPPLLPDELLLCLDRKVASGDQIGLWYRDEKGRLERVWEREPYDCRWLFDRSVLVVERWTGRAVHLSPRFEVLRTVKGFDEPVDIEQTAQGTWIVVESGAGRVVGVDPKSGKRLWTRTGFRTPFDAAPLDDGGVLVADSGHDRVVRLDAKGKVVQTWLNLDFPNSVELTEDGGFLTTNWTGGEVRRYDNKGKLMWRTQLRGTLQSAEERPDGRITVSEGYAGRIHYLTAKGKLEKTEELPRGCVDCETILRD